MIKTDKRKRHTVTARLHKIHTHNADRGDVPPSFSLVRRSFEERVRGRFLHHHGRNFSWSINKTPGLLDITGADQIPISATEVKGCALQGSGWDGLGIGAVRPPSGDLRGGRSRGRIPSPSPYISQYIMLDLEQDKTTQ